MVGAHFPLDEDIDDAYTLDQAQPVGLPANQAPQHPHPPSSHQQHSQAQPPTHSSRSLATSTPMTSFQPIPVHSPHRLSVTAPVRVAIDAGLLTRNDRHHMAGLPSPTNHTEAGEADPSPFAWSPPGTASRATNPYQTIPSPDTYYNTQSFAQYGPASAHSGNPNAAAAGPSTVPTLTYTNASAYGPYGPARRSPHSTHPSPPQQHTYLSTGGDGYTHSSAFGMDQSPSVSPPNPAPGFDPSSYSYSVYPPASLPPPPIYTSAHPHPPGANAPGVPGPSYSHSGSTSPEVAYHPRTSPIALSGVSRYHPYAAAEKAALGSPITPTSPTNKPYACRLCAYTSSRSHDLKRHMRTHTNERPYECEVCHRTFARKDAAKRHMAAKNCGVNAPGAGLGTLKSMADGNGGGPSGPGKAVDGASSEEQSDEEDGRSRGDTGSSGAEELGKMQVDGDVHPQALEPKLENKTPTPPSATAYPGSTAPYPQQHQPSQQEQQMPRQPATSPTQSTSDHTTGPRSGA